jgi:hypothetical protein
MRIKVRRPRFQLAKITVGRDMLTAVSLQSAAGQLPGPVLVTAVSSDAGRVLLSTSPSQPGQARVTMTFGQLQTPLYVHGVAEGSAGITVSATGFDESQSEVAVVPPALFLSSIETAFVGRPTDLYISLNGQTVRPGAQFTVNLRSSDPSVATVTPSVVMEGGAQQGKATVAALAAGQVTVTAEAPGLAPESRLSVTFKTEAPPLPFSSLPATLHVGKGLQAHLALQQVSVSQVKLTVTSSDPAKVLLSTDAKSRGSGSVSVTINQYGQATVFVQAMADSGEASLSLTAPGFAIANATVRLYPSAFSFDRAVATITRGYPFEFGILAAPVLPQNVYSSQTLSLHTAVAVPITTSRPEVGSLKPAAVALAPGENRGSTSFTAAAAGTTTLTITPPAGFAQTNPPAQMTLVVN